MARPKGALQAGSLRWQVERLKVGEAYYVHTKSPAMTASRIHTLYNNHEERSLTKHGLKTEVVLVIPTNRSDGVIEVDEVVRVVRVFDDPYL